MSSSTPVIGVIEWSSDNASEPAVFLGDSPAQIRRAVVEFLEDFLPSEDYGGGINYIDHDWVEEFPLPDLDDEQAVTAWLDQLRADTTDAWLTIYEATRDGEPDSSQYKDVRN